MGEVNYFTRERGGVIDWQRNGTFIKEDGYYTTLIGNEAVKLIEQQDATQAVLPLLRLAGAACAVSGAPGVSRALPDHRGQAAARVRGHDHRARRSGGADRRRTGEEAPARQHDHHLRQRQRRRDQRHVRQRLEEPGRAGARGGWNRTGSQGPCVERPLPRRQGRPVRRAAFASPPSSSWPAKLQPRTVVDGRVHMVDIMPTLLALAGATGSPDHPWTARTSGRPWRRAHRLRTTTS